MDIKSTVRYETYTMTPEEEIKWLRQCVRELQEEKQTLKTKLDDNIKIYLNTSKYASEMEGKYVVANHIITELEKWLYEMNHKHMDDSNFYNSFCFLSTLNKMAELKGNIENGN